MIVSYSIRNIFYLLFLGGILTLLFIIISYSILITSSNLEIVKLMSTQTFFYTYLSISIATSILFGINMTLLIYSWQKYGIKNIFANSGSGLGAVIGLIASTCPVCGSTFLSLIATISGLSFLSSSSLELKVISFFILLASTLYIYKNGINLNCKNNNCPIPRKIEIKNSQLILLGISFGFLLIVNIILISHDPIFKIFPQNYSEHSCGSQEN